MKEEFLHYLWKFQLIDISRLRTTKRDPVSILNTGVHNHDTGPDFLNAKIRISNQIWVGNVEIHLKSSDWYWHQHEIDENYDAVILHVVWDHDVEVFMKNNLPIPTLELKGLVLENVQRNYFSLTKTSNKQIPCASQISSIDPLVISNWLQRLYVERLERKSVLIRTLLLQTNNDWDAVLFLLLARNFGLNKNGDAFFQLAQSIPFSVVRRVAHDDHQLSALIFGQAGFLEGHMHVEYALALKKEYDFLRKKHELQALNKKQFHFFRMRPSNFPTIRLAQFIAVYKKSFHLFSDIMEIRAIEEMYSLFDIQLNEFWKTHYTFSKESKRAHKKLTKSFVDLLVINTIIPLKFCYQKVMNTSNEQELISLLESLKPEKNSTVTDFEEMGLMIKNAFQSQAVLELKNHYCTKKRCLECAIGNKVLRSG